MAANAVAPPKQKISLFGQLQRVGKALMVPVAILPAAGLLLGLGAGFQNMYKQINDVDTIPEGFFLLITNTMVGAGDIIFGNLALLFAIGVAIGLTADAGVAALAGTVGFLVFNKAVSVFMEIKNVNVITCKPAGHDGGRPGHLSTCGRDSHHVAAVHVRHPELERAAVGGLRQHPGHPDAADRRVRRHHHRCPGGLVLQQVVPHRAVPGPRVLRRQALRADRHRHLRPAPGPGRQLRVAADRRGDQRLRRRHQGPRRDRCVHLRPGRALAHPVRPAPHLVQPVLVPVR